jgi:ATP phosphoribosyltransferase-like protein
MRSQSVPRTILLGGAHIGITGEDCVMEDKLDRIYNNFPSQNDVVVLRKLNYNKSSSGFVRVVAVRRKPSNGGKHKEIKDSENLEILSEFPYITRRYYPRAKIQPIIGGAEDEFVAHTNYALAICVTETGAGLEEKNLEIEKVLLKSTAILIAREEKEEFMEFADMLEGVIRAPEYLELKMHVPKEVLENIFSLIPALQEPNVIWLPHRKLYSVETVTTIADFYFLRHKLKPLGVTGFVGRKVDIIIP